MGLVVSLVGACAGGGGAVDTALDRFARPAVVVADRWREAELRDALDKAGIPAADLEVRGMGFRDGADNVRNFQRAIADGRVIPVPSLLWRSAMSEARVTSGPAGNSKLSKNSQGGRRKRARNDDDAILAVAAGVRRPAVPTRRWRYRGMVRLEPRATGASGRPWRQGLTLLFT